jgi:hypothetical protein
VSSRARLLALAVLASSACASLPPCPARGGPAWSEWTSPHFTLFTDLDVDDARSTLRDYEELRAAVHLAAWRRAPEPRGRVVVIALRDLRERHVFVPAGYLATFMTAPPLSQPFIIKSGSERDDVVTWTLVHALGRQYGLQGKVPWFDEGLARYLGPLRLDEDGKVTYGQVDPQLLRALTFGHLTSFENLWNPVPLEDRGKFYATSWVVVHYLFNHEGARFDEFQRRLLTTSDARAAWREVFPDLTSEVMDARLSAYVFREGQFDAFEARLPPLHAATTQAPLSDAQVHALRALLYATTTVSQPAPREALARAEIAEALRLEPLQMLALVVQRLLLRDDEADVVAPKKLIALHPASAAAWLLLARAWTARHDLQAAGEAWDEVRRFADAPDAPIDLELRVARPD